MSKDKRRRDRRRDTDKTGIKKITGLSLPLKEDINTITPKTDISKFDGENDYVLVPTKEGI